MVHEVFDKRVPFQIIKKSFDKIRLFLYIRNFMIENLFTNLQMQITKPQFSD